MNNKNQRGAALVTALVFLVLITLLSVSAMRSSTLELKMAGNEQAHADAVQSAQSALDAVISAGSFTTGSIGYVTCYNPPASVTDCDAEETLTGIGYGSDNYVRVQTVTTAACPRLIDSSARGSNSARTSSSPMSTGNCAYFNLTSLYDATDAGGGRAQVVQGLTRIIF